MATLAAARPIFTESPAGGQPTPRPKSLKLLLENREFGYRARLPRIREPRTHRLIVPGLSFRREPAISNLDIAISLCKEE